MNYDEMPSGDDLNMLIAEQIMGWRWYWWTVANSQEAVRGLFAPDFVNPYHYQPWTPTVGALRISTMNLVPHYSTDIADAWLVVEKLQDECGSIAIERERDEEGWLWRCQIYSRDDETFIEACAPTPSLAICRAALAIGKE